MHSAVTTHAVDDRDLALFRVLMFPIPTAGMNYTVFEFELFDTLSLQRAQIRGNFQFTGGYDGAGGRRFLIVTSCHTRIAGKHRTRHSNDIAYLVCSHETLNFKLYSNNYISDVHDGGKNWPKWILKQLTSDNPSSSIHHTELCQHAAHIKCRLSRMFVAFQRAR